MLDLIVLTVEVELIDWTDLSVDFEARSYRPLTAASFPKLSLLTCADREAESGVDMVKSSVFALQDLIQYTPKSSCLGRRVECPNLVESWFRCK